MELGTLVGSRLVRVRDGRRARCTSAVVREAELTVLNSDDMLGTLERGVLPGAASRRSRSSTTRRSSFPSRGSCWSRWIAPETWAAGVTYERSRSARMHESKVVDVYELVYDAERPELFLKDAAGRRTVGPGAPIAARSDASWTVPEPELAVVLGAQRAARGDDRQRRVLARHRRREPSVPPAGQDLRPGVRARPGAARARVVGRALPDRMPDPRCGRRGAVRRGDFDREHAPLDRRARRVPVPRQPGARRAACC